jgi:hypothetical protein
LIKYERNAAKHMWRVDGMEWKRVATHRGASGEDVGGAIPKGKESDTCKGITHPDRLCYCVDVGDDSAVQDQHQIQEEVRDPHAEEGIPTTTTQSLSLLASG